MANGVEAGTTKFAHRLQRAVHRCVSRSEQWNNSALVQEITPENMHALKQEPGRDIVIYGSASVVRALVRLDLIERYQLLVFPVLLGRGKPLFHDLLHKQPLKLINTQTYPSGVVELAYQQV